MHIWHHSRHLPKKHRRGVNFGLTLSIWDYIFKTAYVPESSIEVETGFENDEIFPKGFWEQVKFPFKKF